MSSTIILPKADDRRNRPATRRRVYFACPVPEFHAPRYDRMRQFVLAHYGDIQLFEARQLFTSSAHWLAEWPKLLPTLDEVVFFASVSGYIGRGVAIEIRDARRQRIPVHYLLDDGQLLPFGRLWLSPPNEDDWTQYRQVNVIPEALTRDWRPAWMTY